MKSLRMQLCILYRGLSDADTPWYVKCLAGLIVAYIISPIDLIPDFIPVLGLLDEAVLVPIGIALALKLMPVEIRQRYEQETEMEFPGKMIFVGSAVVILAWLVAMAIVYTLWFRF